MIKESRKAVCHKIGIKRVLIIMTNVVTGNVNIFHQVFK